MNLFSDLSNNTQFYTSIIQELKNSWDFKKKKKLKHTFSSPWILSVRTELLDAN